MAEETLQAVTRRRKWQKRNFWSFQHEVHWAFAGFVAMEKMQPCACRRVSLPQGALPQPLWIWGIISGTSGSAGAQKCPSSCAAQVSSSSSRVGMPRLWMSRILIWAGLKPTRTCWCQHQAGLGATCTSQTTDGAALPVLLPAWLQPNGDLGFWKRRFWVSTALRVCQAAVLLFLLGFLLGFTYLSHTSA